MKILKYKGMDYLPLRFTCPYCDTEYEAEQNEYSVFDKIYATCSCPVCENPNVTVITLASKNKGGIK